jgi:hypothetical protein
MGRRRDEIDRANLSRAREANALAAEAKRRESKGKVSAAEVQMLMDSMTNEGRAVVTAMASNKLGVRPDLPWLRR